MYGLVGVDYYSGSGATLAATKTNILFAWCTYFVTDGTEMLKFKSTTVDTKFPQYTYLMLTIKPQFYKTSMVAESK